MAITSDLTFGPWLRRCRRERDLTHAELAAAVGCSASALRKFEAGDLRPSRLLAEALAGALHIPSEERADFVRFARELPSDAPVHLPIPIAGWEHSASAVHGSANLPFPPTTLIGRAQECAALVHLLRRSETHLVTLTGPGGIGKTRLGLQVAAELIDDFPDGVYFVDLAPLRTPTLVSSAIAQTLGLRETADQPLVAQLTQFLSDKRMLLLLDNFEHVLDAAPLLAELLTTTSRLKLLVTSRERLHLRSEQEVAVQPLGLPPPDGHTHSVVVGGHGSMLGQYAAVALFVERAQAVKADFVLTDERAVAVAEICIRLDGLPLAIELAAARVKLFPLPTLLARLEQRLSFLTSGPRDLPLRQQTIRATIDWSYHLLDADEQFLFTRLAVFVGGWTLDAAEMVCADGTGDVLDLLMRLVDKSLVQVEEHANAVRYDLHETLRQYAVEKLAARGQTNRLRGRHATYFLALVEAVPEWHRAPRRLAWLAQLETEHDNLRATFQWAVEQPTSGIALRLAGGLGWFWYRRGDWSEGRTWLQHALERDGSAAHSATYAWLLYTQGELAWMQGDSTGGQALFEQSMALFRELHDLYGMATVQYCMGEYAREQGDVARATALLEDHLQDARAHGNTDSIAAAQVSLGAVAVLREDPAVATALLEAAVVQFRALGVRGTMGRALNSLGHVAQLQGDYARAAALHRESLTVLPETLQRDIGWAREGLGEVALAQGDLAAATMHFTASLRIFQRCGDPAIIWSLAGLGSVAALHHKPQRAARLWGTVEVLRKTTGKRAAPASRATYERALAAAHDQLDDATFAAAWEAGRAMTLEEAIAYAFGDSNY